MNNAQWISALLAIQGVCQVSAEQRSKLLESKVVGGSQTNIKEVPFLLSLHDRKNGFICGASILSPLWGVTALHCIKPNSAARNYYVRSGSSVNIHGGFQHKILKFNSFKSSTFDGKSIPKHDIVLFSVSPRFRFSDKVRPAKLPVYESISPKTLQISGWGRTESTNGRENTTSSWSLHLQAVNVSRVDLKKCIEKASWYKQVVNEKMHLCYGGYRADACYGDSGGPLANSKTIYGIVSFGSGCGVVPGIYTKILYYNGWIKNIIN